MLTKVILSFSLVLGAGAAPVEIKERQLLGGLLGGGGSGMSGCSRVYHVHARGTAEPGLNDLGMLVGSPFSTALTLKLPGTTSVGVSYSASIIGAVTGAMMPGMADGASKMTSMVKEVMGRCPNTKIVMSGYSQGAEQVHGALQNLGADGRKVAAAVTFGDPMSMTIVKAANSLRGLWGSLPADRAKMICYAGDPVCGGIGLSHLSYASSANEAANFVVKAINSMGGAGAAAAPAATGRTSLFNIFSFKDAGMDGPPTYGP